MSQTYFLFLDEYLVKFGKKKKKKNLEKQLL